MGVVAGVLRRFHVLANNELAGAKLQISLHAYRVNPRKGCVELAPMPTRPEQYSFVLVDESHHVYTVEKWRTAIESFVTEGKTWLWLLSDISQSQGKVIPYPPGLHREMMLQVVRNTLLRGQNF